MKTNRHSADVFRALGDEHRLKMLAFVAAGDAPGGDDGPGICSCHIQAHVGLAQPTVSHHMRILADAGLVAGEKRGKWVYYRLIADGFAQAQEFLRPYLTLARLAASGPRRRAAGT
jgi:ArsR family transcriptional regulator